MSKLQIEEIQKIPIHYIIALPRTGSTLLFSMLSQLDNVLTILEEPFYLTLYDKYHDIKSWSPEVISNYVNDFYLFAEHKQVSQMPKRGKLYSRLINSQELLNWDSVVQLTFKSFQQTRQKNNIECIVCKELSIHNHLVELSERYPSSKFIYLYRNPWDNISRWKNFRSKRLKKEDSVSNLAIKWVYRNNKIIESKSKINSSRILEITYARLVTNPEHELKKICHFLNIQYNEKMLHYADAVKLSLEQLERKQKDAKKNFIALHSGLLNKPTTNKIGRWKKEITLEEASIIKELTLDTATQIGFDIPESIPSGDTFFLNIKKSMIFFKKRVVYTLWWKSPFWMRRFIKRLKYEKLIRKLYDN